MKRKPCIKDENDNVQMTEQNLSICLHNQEGSYQTKQLNQSLHLQYYGFTNIQNLSPFYNIHSLFINNNTIQRIEGLESLEGLRTINLSYNRIKKFEGIKNLKQLYTLDLSNNLIQQIPSSQTEGLSSLNTLKLGQNKLRSLRNIKSITNFNLTLTYLDLSKNQEFQYCSEFYSQFLSKLPLISVISLQNTLFSRNAPSYRKQMINSGKSLVYLDDRTVSQDQRALAVAWKEGGLILQKQVRAKLRQKTVAKQGKIYEQIQQRNRIVQIKRKQVLNKLISRQLLTLQSLYQFKKSQDFQLLQIQKSNIVNLQIQDLQRYVELMEQNIGSYDLEKELSNGNVQLPKMIVDKQTTQAIYIYNVSQEQIPLIKQKYYSEETRPLIAVSYQQPRQSRWIKEYDSLLQDCYEQLKGNYQLLVPTFNLSIYDFDKSVNRKVQRFELQQLKQHLKMISKQEEQRQKSIQALYQLD